MPADASTQVRANEASHGSLDLKLVGEISGHFRVPRYQRGYRWGHLEVERLLDDIYENGDKDYNLQPVVVKRDSDEVWELVDGQQRLTTLYLVFTFLNRSGLKNVGPQYSISYDTKPETGDYLLNPDPSLSERNIDLFHIHQAYACIEAWFEKHGKTPIKRQEVADDVFRYLCKSVRIIWYQAPEGLDSSALFTRLNVGRIPLTDAELFKALLLSHSRGDNGSTDRTHEIAAQWDAIERSLQDPDIWAFVAENVTTVMPTRITLLLDTIAGGPRGRSRPRFHTFDVLRTRIEDLGSAKEVWEQVVELHARMLGWYESRDLYHKVGYLVAVGHRFADLVALAAEKPKSEFASLLNERIRASLDLTPSDLEELDYEGSKETCRRVLLLLNVETVRRMQDSSERYSFRRHRQEDWSLEHIHAQNAERLTTAEQWRTWLQLHRDALADLPISADRRDRLVARIDAVGDDIDRQTFQELAREVSAAFTPKGGSPESVGTSLHSISNLALLSSRDNTALSNSVFEVKRQRILALDRSGAYIPICTRQVFLKYFTDADVHQAHFWSKQDREAYLEALLSSEVGVGKYLKPEEAEQ